MKYAELFSGIGVGSLAIQNVFGDKAECAFFSEINKPCIKSYLNNFPTHKNVGDIEFVEIDKLPSFDLLVGGSPCQDLSIARGKREGLDGDQSGLFYRFLDILREKKPRFFLLENVASMKDEDKDEISRCLGVQPIEISSIHFTGQDRKRYYWANFPIAPIPKKKLDARNVIDKTDKPTEKLDWKKLHSVWIDGEKKPKSFLKTYKSDWDFVGWSRSTRYKKFKTQDEMNEFVDGLQFKVFGALSVSYVEQRVKINMGANTLVTGKNCARFSAKNLVRHGDKVRPINRLECLRLQGLPDNFLDGISDSAAFNALGNSFTYDVIEHIMKSLKNHLEKIGA